MVTRLMENTTIGHEQISNLPMFGIQRFREFMQVPQVWGKVDKVYWDDVLIHVRDNGKIYSFSNEVSENTLPLTDDFLVSFSDKAIIYIECGYIQTSDPKAKTRFVRVYNDFDSKEWSKDLAEVVRAWDIDFYQDLQLNRAA